jgi:hypothetical protein
MIKNFNQPIAVLSLILGVCINTYSQSGFTNAHALLQKLAQDRLAAKTSLARNQLAEEVHTVPLRVEELMTQGIIDLLNSGQARSLEYLQQKVSTTLQVGPQEAGNIPDVYVLLLGPAGNPSYVVVYEIPYCADCSRSWIGVFAQDNNQYRLRSSLEDPLPNQSIRAVPLWVSSNGIRFLVYGTTWGDAHNRLNIAAYFYDGRNIGTIWSRMGLTQGTVDVKSGAMVISFLTTLRPPWNKRTEIYDLTATGIHLQNATESPEP